MPLIQESEDGVIIDDIVIAGFVDDKVCGACEAPRVYHEAFDAFFCATCNCWLEEACSDPSCVFCTNRPVHPLAAA
jgi:hypothetical protein